MQIQAKNIPELNNLIQNDPVVEQEFRDNPKEAIQKYTQSQLPNTTIYKMVVGSLGLVIVIITLGIVWRIASGDNIEDKIFLYPHRTWLINYWGIGGLLAPSPSRG